jgi:plastocyanin
MKLPLLAILGAVVVVIAASACGGGNGSSGSKEKSSSGSGTVIKTITISETEYKLTPSKVTLSKPGTYEFKVVNKGTITHALEVEGPGDEAKSSDIEPGKSTTLKATLDKSGTYEMYCPIDGHRQEGMEGKVTVGSGGTMTTTGTTTSSGY